MANLPDFPGVSEHADEIQDKAAELLRRAAGQCTALVPGEHWAEQAERLSQAATYAGVAAAQLHKSAGYLYAAAAASEVGLLDGEENDHG